MADVTLTYKGQTILELSASGNKTIKTSGKYCEGDINLAYIRAGSSYNILKGSAQPSAGIGQDGDVYLQYVALDGEIVNTYVKISGAWVALVGSDVDDVSNSGMYTGTVAPPPASLGTDGDYYYQRDNLQRSIQRVNTSSIIGTNNTSVYGTEFTVTQSVTVTHLFARIESQKSGMLQIGTTSQILAETATVSFNAGELKEVPLDSPIQLSPGTNYVVRAWINGAPGWISYVKNISDLTYDSKFSFVATRYGASWPGSIASGTYAVVGISYKGLYKIIQQFHKESGSWSEIT